MFERHHHEYEQKLAEEEKRAGLPPQWIPFIGPLYAAIFVALIAFLGYAVLWKPASPALGSG